MEKQYVIYLNGITACGKSSISKELLKMIKEPTIYLSLDNVHYNLCEEYSTPQWKLYKKECLGLHKSALVWLEQGFNVIIDTVIESKKLFENALEVLPKNTYYVGVFAPLEILLEREAKRGTNEEHQIRVQIDRVHKGVNYDLEVNSTYKNPSELAKQIIDFVNLKN